MLFISQKYPYVWLTTFFLCSPLLNEQCISAEMALPSKLLPVSRVRALYALPKQISFVAALEKLHNLVLIFERPASYLCKTLIKGTALHPLINCCHCQADELLTHKQNGDGAYLVRYSNNKRSFVLSIKVFLISSYH